MQQTTYREAREFRRRWARLCLNSEMKALREPDLAEGSLGGRANPSGSVRAAAGAGRQRTHFATKRKGSSWASWLPSVPGEVAQEGGSWCPVDAGATLPAAFTDPD